MAHKVESLSCTAKHSDLLIEFGALGFQQGKLLCP